MNNSLKYLAEALAREQISALRYNKRMIGASRSAGQRESDLRFDHYVDDAIAVARYLKERVGDPVFLIGHSEGGHIAITAAERSSVARAIVVLAGPGRHPADTIEAQLRAQLEIIDGMNHVLKLVAGDGAAQAASYSDPTLPVAPELVRVVADFVSQEAQR